jgi:hypothetical protein
MKHIISGLVIISILLISGVVAEDSNDTVSDATLIESWMLDNETAAAMIELYAIDLRMIEDGYGAVILKNLSEKEDFKVYTEDPDGTVDALLDIIEAETLKNEDASADLQKLYNTYDLLNATGDQMLSSFEANELVAVDEEVSAYKDAAVDLTSTFDEFIAKYIDKDTINEQAFRLLLYTHLLGAVNAQEGYVLTADPALSEKYVEKMAAFDADAAAFEARFPDVSIDEMKELKEKAYDIVLKTIQEGSETGAEMDLTALMPVVIEIMDGYRQTTTLQ